MQSSATRKQIKRLLQHKKILFVLAGISNTIIDFACFNVALLVLGFKPWIANILSTSVAMAVSFFVNKRVVFRSDKTRSYGQFAAFILVTLVGLWGLQTLIILGAGSVLRSIALHTLNLNQHTAHWVAANCAKAVATVVSAVWNYLWYDRVIFAHSSARNKVQGLM